jgi:anti-sigma regulatory factor (Ser/Thr protein kinase)
MSDNGRPASATLSVTLVTRRDEISRLGRLVDEFAAAHGVTEDDVAAVHLALDEIVVNVIRYGHDDGGEHPILVVLTLDRPALTIRVEDDGRPFNPLEAPAPDLTLSLEERPIGGLGIHMVKMSMDEVAYRRDGDRNVLTMTKRVA